MLCRWYYSDESQQRWHSRSEESIRHHAGASTQDEPNQVLPRGPVVSCLDFLLCPKKFISTLRKSVPFKKYNLQGISKNLEDCRDVWPISRDLYQISHNVANSSLSWRGRESRLYGIVLANKRSRKSSDTSHIHLSWCSSIRKTIPNLC